MVPSLICFAKEPILKGHAVRIVGSADALSGNPYVAPVLLSAGSDEVFGVALNDAATKEKVLVGYSDSCQAFVSTLNGTNDAFPGSYLRVESDGSFGLCTGNAGGEGVAMLLSAIRDPSELGTNQVLLLPPKRVSFFSPG